ncbi:hypothetical protein ACFE04_025705 [Oxalis oulophora]
MEDKEANLESQQPRPHNSIINNPESTSSSLSSFSSSSSSPPGFLRHVQAAFKRHRPLGTVQSSSIAPRRSVLPKRETSKNISAPNIETKSPLDDDLHGKNNASVGADTQQDASITPPSFLGTITKNSDETFNQLDTTHKEQQLNPESCQRQPNADKRVQFSTGNNTGPQGADAHLAAGIENLTSCMDSLSLTEMEWDMGNQRDATHDDSKHQNFHNSDPHAILRSDVDVTNRTAAVHDQLHQFRNFLSQPVTQSSAVRSSCATTTNVNPTSAPMLNSTTRCSLSQRDASTCTVGELLGESDVHPKPLSHGNLTQPSNSSLKEEGRENDLPKNKKGSFPKEGDVLKNPSPDKKHTRDEGCMGNITGEQSQASLSKNRSADATSDPSKVKQEKVVSKKGASAPRKRNYDPDLFFKVNGKLYQRLGKIGSGGSSEVHKVISSDCKIFALKKIKLKGRDYATAFGFCQEIEYLSRLKGKSNIIQLVDYEVTDKALLREVMSGSISNKDGRVKDDEYIYMVLEHGEIDLAHMLSQKWKQLDDTDQTIDENWLRFYWQQILLAVNTIHEERIVHSDLKPANFLLVKGSLKLIDFGIAKAIMSDTTNIQRDSQVGTLSYMSPEAFMCNERDSDGNTIKCGRPSDIWSLGCILYQMVYGRTPFSEYKTFWAKFKVITDPNHEIIYEPLSNLWLVDIMKKCLAWDRNERWRIPELLQHPFLVPPSPLQQPSSSEDQSCKLLQLIAESSANDLEASLLCSKLDQLLRESGSESLTSRDQQCKLLGQMSELCFQLQECLKRLEHV